MLEKLRYVTDERGERVGVLLDVAEYQQLTARLTPDPDLLVGLSQAELEALAEIALAPVTQTHLADLLAQSAEGKLTVEETAELDHLLEHVDQLNMLKTRARYTLSHHDLPAIAT